MPARDLSARLRDSLTSLRRTVLRRRRLLAVLCAVGAVGTGLRATAPPAPPTDQVVVAGRDLAAGAVLRAEDLREVEVAPEGVPSGALTDADEAAGAILAAPLRAREVVTDVRLVGPELVDGAPGTVAVPVRVSDAAQVGLLEVGDEIDLLATDPESRTTTRVASGVLVLAVPPLEEGSPDAITGRLIVVGLPEPTVGAVSGAAVTSFVTYSWTSR